MKRCPQCRRDYYDDTLLYCLDDGNVLLDGPASWEGPVTAILPASAASLPSEAGTAVFTSNDSIFDAPTSIAVLPFANMSADEENEYFCDGMAEELLNGLSKLDKLKVAARTSAFFFKGKNVDVSEIGEKLGVSKVLEGSVRKAGKRVRISVKLVSAADGFQLWSETYDREMNDIFELQDEITLSVIGALKLKLLGEERDVVLKRYTHNAEAYELYLKGRYYHYKYTAEGWKTAIEYFRKATEIEPNYAPAYAAMTSSWGCLCFFGLVPPETVIPPMKEATERAMEIDETLAESHLSRAMVSFFYDWDWPTAEQAYSKAITLDPSNAEALSFYAMFLAFMGCFDDALEQNRRSIVNDPLSLLINMNAGWTYFTFELFDEASRQVETMLEIEPNFYGAYWLNGAINLAGGDFEKAIVELRKGVSLGGHQTVLADLGAAYGLAGQIDEAKKVLDQLLEMRENDYVSAICIARVYSRIGDNEKAVEWLETAFEERNGEMLFLKGEIAGAAEGDSLHTLGRDPRVIRLFEKMDLPQQ